MDYWHWQLKSQLGNAYTVERHWAQEESLRAQQRLRQRQRENSWSIAKWWGFAGSSLYSTCQILPSEALWHTLHLFHKIWAQKPNSSMHSEIYHSKECQHTQHGYCLTTPLHFWINYDLITIIIHNKIIIINTFLNTRIDK